MSRAYRGALGTWMYQRLYAVKMPFQVSTKYQDLLLKGPSFWLWVDSSKYLYSDLAGIHSICKGLCSVFSCHKRDLLSNHSSTMFNFKTLNSRSGRFKWRGYACDNPRQLH